MSKSASSGSGQTASVGVAYEDIGALPPENLGAITRVFNEPIPTMDSCPYPHISLENVFDDAFLRSCLKELKTCLTGNFKETDLFKVYQTTDLANLESCVVDQSDVTNLLRLRRFLYSSKFRMFVEETTGCTNLNGAVDCSCNIYTPSCHLLCHDDVIGLRKISYIIYLTDPDEEWNEADGGQLELYGVDIDQESPCSNPEISLLPKWNSMVMFEVLPGRSFHAVREVSSHTKTRVSISGWFHAKEAPDIVAGKKKLSTLQQLRSSTIRCTENDDKIELNLDRVRLRGDSSSSLSGWINPEYLSRAGMSKIQKHFAVHGSVQLFDFILPDICNPLKSKLIREEHRNSRMRCTYEYGSGLGWKVRGPPHLRRYLRYEPNTSQSCFQRSDVGDALEIIRKEVFATTEFINWIETVTGSMCRLSDSEIRRFRPGFDYTLAHETRESCAEIDITACFTGDSIPSSWESGDVGGYRCFMHDFGVREGAEDVYEEQDMNDGLQSACASFNSVLIVRVNNSVGDFVKYVSTFAPCSRWDIVTRLHTPGTE